MSDATDYAEEAFGDMWFKGVDTAPVADGNLEVALWTTAPAEAPDSTNEVDNTNEYSRVAVSQADWSKDTSGSGANYTNAVDIDFGVLNSGGSTSVEGVVLVRTDTANTSSGTEEYIYANGDVSESVAAGNEFKINANDASFSID